MAMGNQRDRVEIKGAQGSSLEPLAQIQGPLSSAKARSGLLFPGEISGIMINMLDIEAFVRTNKRVFIWAGAFGLVYGSMKLGIFGLAFIIFILCFLFKGVIDWAGCRVRLPRWLLTVVVYLLFLTFIVTVVSFVVPRVVKEAKLFLLGVPRTIDSIHVSIDKLAEGQPQFEATLNNLKKYISLESLVGVDSQTVISIAFKSFDQLYTYISNFLLGTLFSFLILLDFENLRVKVRSLRNTRLIQIYDEVEAHLTHFGRVVGYAFRAQILVAMTNTVFTAVGLWILDIQPILLLCTIVFFAGLIPVLGTFISSTPILLVAGNLGGVVRMTAALVLILVIHAFENYLIFPRIHSMVFKIAPVYALIILYLAYHVGGLWGMLLGMPVTVFIFRYLIQHERDTSFLRGLTRCPASDISK